jgi:FkbM family methyltransferase
MSFKSEIPGSHVVDKTFHGHPYKHVCVDRPPHWQGWIDPSRWSFDDEADIRDKCWNVKPGDLVFDVGAAYGSYTITALACGASYVYAWSPQGEPGDPHQEADFLRESLALNGWEDRVSIFEHGAYSKLGWLNTSTQEVLTAEPSPPNPDVIEVIPLDLMMAGVAFTAHDDNAWKEAWFKLDVEGAEVEVLKGAKAVLKRLRPYIFVENHLFKDPFIGTTVRNLLESGELGVKFRHESTTPYGSISHSLYTPA